MLVDRPHIISTLRRAVRLEKHIINTCAFVIYCSKAEKTSVTCDESLPAVLHQNLQKDTKLYLSLVILYMTIPVFSSLL